VISSEAWISELRAIVGPQDVITDKDQLAGYAGDEFPLDSLRQSPGVAVKPHTAQQISQILKLANRYKIPVTARGGGVPVCVAGVCPQRTAWCY